MALETVIKSTESWIIVWQAKNFLNLSDFIYIQECIYLILTLDVELSVFHW